MGAVTFWESRRGKVKRRGKTWPRRKNMSPPTRRKKQCAWKRERKRKKKRREAWEIERDWCSEIGDIDAKREREKERDGEESQIENPNNGIEEREEENAEKVQEREEDEAEEDLQRENKTKAKEDKGKSPWCVQLRSKDLVPYEGLNTSGRGNWCGRGPEYVSPTLPIPFKYGVKKYRGRRTTLGGNS